jgi:hypothetical protein
MHRLMAVITVAVGVVSVGPACSGNPTPGSAIQTTIPSMQPTTTEAVASAAPTTPAVTSPGAGSPSAASQTSAATPTLATDSASWDAFVAAIDPTVRASEVVGDWHVVYTLADYDGEGVDYHPYIPVGADELWEWTVSLKCDVGPCNIHFDAYNAILNDTFPSGLDWNAEKEFYYSSGVTAAPAAFCHDSSGGRITDSYEVEQALSLVPTQAMAGDDGGLMASEMNGRRVDVGRPVEGMPETCGVFTELWSIHATRP